MAWPSLLPPSLPQPGLQRPGTKAEQRFLLQQGPAHLPVADELCTCAPNAHCMHSVLLCAQSAYCVHRGSGLSTGLPADGHCIVPSGAHDGTARAGLPT